MVPHILLRIRLSALSYCERNIVLLSINCYFALHFTFQTILSPSCWLSGQTDEALRRHISAKNHHRRLNSNSWRQHSRVPACSFPMPTAERWHAKQTGHSWVKENRRQKNIVHLCGPSLIIQMIIHQSSALQTHKYKSSSCLFDSQYIIMM